MNLICHPQFRHPDVLGVECRVHRENAQLALAYLFFGDLSRIVVPEARIPRQSDNLWRHTCFEAFVAPEGGREYYEYNFSPTGEWAVFAFEDYRKRKVLPNQAREPVIAVRQTEGLLELDAIVFLDRLPAAPAKLGVSAVVEHENGELSYWALKHPRAEPDFHHRDSFALAI